METDGAEAESAGEDEAIFYSAVLRSKLRWSSLGSSIDQEQRIYNCKRKSTEY